MDGFELITIERQRQISEEGWSAEHDDAHAKGEMEDAAYVYFAVGLHPSRVVLVLTGADGLRTHWPWDWTWFKPFDKNHHGTFPKVDRMRCLVKAGALALAEADRYSRLHGDLERASEARMRNLVLDIAHAINELPK